MAMKFNGRQAKSGVRYTRVRPLFTMDRVEMAWPATMLTAKFLATRG
jgi:hypothetical protein